MTQTISLIEEEIIWCWTNGKLDKKFQCLFCVKGHQKQDSESWRPCILDWPQIPGVVSTRSHKFQVYLTCDSSLYPSTISIIAMCELSHLVRLIEPRLPNAWFARLTYLTSLCIIRSNNYRSEMRTYLYKSRVPLLFKTLYACKDPGSLWGWTISR